MEIRPFRRGMAGALGRATHRMLPFQAVQPFDTTAATTAVVVAEDRPAATPPARAHDHLFPGHGRISTSLATGVPFLAMGELSVGMSDRFALGAIGGATPNVPGFGIRPRAVVVEVGSWRGVVAAPVLYYPFTSNRSGSAWFLTRPSVVVEHQFANGVRVGGGAGIVAAASLDRIVGRERPAGYTGGMDSAVWNTFNATVAVPIGASTSLFADAALIMKGVRVAGDDWVGGPPFIVSLGVATNLF